MTDIEKRFLQKLETSLSPFENFVSKSEIEEKLKLVDTRTSCFNTIASLLQSNHPCRVLPISGVTGVGKTFVCWKIKRSIQIQPLSIFLEVPMHSKFFYYNIYTHILEEIGASKLKDISMALADKWGAREIKYGLFRVNNTQRILQHAKMTAHFQECTHKSQLEECMKMVILHAIDAEKSQTAERWLLGQQMDAEDLFYLGIENNLSAKFMTEELLRLISPYLDQGVVLIYDDLDKNWIRYNSRDFFDEEEDDMDRSERIEQGINQNKQLFNDFYQVLQANPRLKLIFTMHSENQSEFLSQFPINLKEMMTDTVQLPQFQNEDIKDYFQAAIQEYGRKNNMDTDFSQPYFPLSEKILEGVQRRSGGNPRDAIRTLQHIFDELVLDGADIASLEKKYAENV